MKRKRNIVFLLAAICEIVLLFNLNMCIPVAKWILLKSDCPFRKTIAVPQQWDRFQESIKDVVKQSKQIQKSGDMELWQTPQGNFWVPAGRATKKDGDLEPLAENNLGYYGRIYSGEVVIDCGAAIGTFVRHSLDKGASLVVAIEPAPEDVPCLRKTFEREIMAGQVIIYPKGVWNRDENLPLYGKGLGSSVVNKIGEVDSVIQLTTLDKIVSELNLTRIDFVKMDIEGAESKALQGARETILRFHPRMAISTEHSANQPREVSDTMKAIAPEYTASCSACVDWYSRIVPFYQYYERARK